MFSPTRRSMREANEAKLPRAAWRSSCVRPGAVLEGLGGLSHRTNMGAVSSSFGTRDCAVMICADRPNQLQDAGALP